ncbi:MAG: hypothetical protein ACI3V0_04080 [Faecousia sp.]
MKGRKMMKGLSFINPKYVHEGEFEGISAPEKSTHSHRKLVALILAACLVFSLAATAYAANLFGIRELFRTYYRELPETAEAFIQQETAAAEAEEGWSCAITESLSDNSTVMATVTIRGGDKYIVAPTDANPDGSARVIGIAGEQTLSEYAASQGKKLLLVGASILKVGDEEIGGGSQRMENISESEMIILTQCTKTVSGSNLEAVCVVYALEEGSNEVQRVELPFVLSEAPATSEGVVYHPLKPGAIPGLTFGDMAVTETPLGYNIRMPATVTDWEARRNIMKVEIEGLTYGEGGGFMEDETGNCYFEAYMCQGTLGDILIVHYYDCDKQPIGDIEFRKVIQ